MRKIKILFYFLLSFLISTNSFSSTIYQTEITNCLLKNTSERDKIILARWLMTAMSEHSSIKSKINLPVRTKQEFQQAFANYVEYILGDKCLKEAKNAMKYDEKGFEKAFEVLGEVAMINLMEDANVMKSLEEWVNYVSEDFIKKIN